MKANLSRKNPKALPCLMGIVVAWVACVQPVHAAEYNWGVTSGGDYNYWMNWIPFGVPGDSDVAVFDLPYNMFIHIEDAVTTNKRLSVEDGMVTFLMGVPSGTCAAPAEYNLLGSGTFIRTAATIGTAPAVPATLRIRHSVTQCDPDSWVNADGMLIIGQGNNSIGTLVLGDSTTQSTIWTSAYPTLVGSAGQGVLEIQKADELINSSATLGSAAGAVGTASVWGTWTNNGTLTIGYSGTGTMSVYHTVTNTGDAYVGKEPGSVGTVNLLPDWGMSPTPDGWLCGGSLYVGGNDNASGGTGTINLTNSGYVQVDQGTTVWNSGLINIDAGRFQANDVNIRTGGHVIVDGSESATGGIFECTDLTVWGSGRIDVTSPTGIVNCTSLHSMGDVWINNGFLFVGDQLSSSPGAVLSLAHGTINVGAFSGYYGSIDWYSGTINITGDDLLIDNGQPLGDDLYVNDGKSLSVSGELGVGGFSDGAMTVTVGGKVSSGTGVVGSLSGSAGLGSVSLAGADTSWTISGDLQVRGVNDAELLLFGAATVSNGDAYLAADPGTLAEVSLTASGTEWNCNGSLYAGGDSAAAGGTGTLDVNNSAELTVDGTMKVWDDFVVQIDGGTVVTTDLDIAGEVAVLGSGVLDVRGGTINLNDTGTLVGPILGNGTTSVHLNDAGTSWSAPGTLVVGTPVQGIGHVAYLALETGTTLTVADTVSVQNGTWLALNGGTVNANSIDLFGTDFSGFGALNGDVMAAGEVTATGDLMVGDTSSDNGVQIGGTLNVGTHHVTLNKQGSLLLADSVNIAGGTLTVPHGLRLTFGDNANGYGVIDTPDDPASPFVVDGSITAYSTNRRIELTGYLKGRGMLDNVIIFGTDNPGFADPAAVNRGSVDYAGKLVIEIGGLNAGSEYDQINHSGAAGLGGELIVELINGFEPGPGDSFTILTYGGHSGAFHVLSLPTLPGGLPWHVDYGPSSLILVVDAQIPGNCDMDGDVDLTDHQDFETCFAGPSASVPIGCDCFDVNNSGAVDLADFALIQTAFTGPS